MDLLEQYIFDNSLSVERILAEVDEYTLFIYYLGYEPELRKAYSSPLHKDDRPSFSVYESRSNPVFDYLWKDSARNISGSIFKLVKLIYNYDTYDEVYARIAKDFEIGEYTVDERSKICYKERPVSKPVTRIRIKSKPFSKEGLAFWNSYHITEELLRWKGVKEVEFVWYNDEQQFPYTCRTLTFAYPEYNLKYKSWHYQIYSPYDREYKFRNDLLGNMLYGNNHLTYTTDTLIVTKSNKDILVLKALGYESVSPRSETTPIKLKHLTYYMSQYKRVVVMFDNDQAGIDAANMYNLESVVLPLATGCKDVSDYVKLRGVESGCDMMRRLLYV